VDALHSGGYVRASLVAEIDQRVIGHVLFSYLPIVTEGGTIPALALAPMAVLPEFQNQGLGSALVHRGLEVCKEQGHQIVVVLGHPSYYQRFGFSSKMAARLASPYSGRESFMALELVPGALGGVTGRVAYPLPFEQAPQTRQARKDDQAECLRNDTARSMSLIVLDGAFAVCRFAGDASVPPWATAGDFFSITRTASELSTVCRQEPVPEGVPAERGWRCLRVAGTMPFSVVGVLASLTVPLAEAGISVFAVSTFDTDYLLIKETYLAAAVDALRQRGHAVRWERDRP
jgi:putative acetyltransferase